MLSLLASIYAVVADIRNALYDKGILDTTDLGVRTISVGNLTAGGTGKTPLVAHIARLLAAGGETVCILTRGYGRSGPKQRVLVSDRRQVLADPSTAGDEPFELAHKLLGSAIVIADADRIAAADWARRKFGVTAFILDDGFQHRKVSRDLDIVCVDALAPYGGDAMLPQGLLREPLRHIARADVIVITRGGLAGNVDQIKSRISELNPAAPVFVANYAEAGVTRLKDFIARLLSDDPNTHGINADMPRRSVDEFVNTPAAAFCALGNPENFFAQLRTGSGKGRGLQLSLEKPFPDHHRYTQADIETLEESAGRAGAKVLFTTAKDAVKLQDIRFTLPCYVIEIEVVLNDPLAFAALL